MTQLNYQPDLNRVPETLPSGIYTVTFEDCKERTSTFGEDYLTFVWRIADGEYVGKKISDNIYYFATDPEYKEKAVLKLDRLCQIFGIEYLGNTDLLWQKKCLAHTGNRLNSQGQSSAYVKSYWPLPENQSPSAEKKISQNPNA